MVTVAEMQKMLGIGRNTAYKLLSEQVIKSRKIGRVYLISKKNIVKFLKNK